MNALSLSSSATVQQVERSLSDLRISGGGWSYQHDGRPQIEPTAFALLALAAHDSKHLPGDLIPAELAALTQRQAADGSFHVLDGYEKSTWPTAFAALALTQLKPDSPALANAVHWLLGQQGQTTLDYEAYRRDFDIDPRLAGWSWTNGTFSWVEPTAWVVLALKRAGLSDHSRVRQGVALLLDRAFEEGGINYGNRLVFGRPTEPVPSDTAAFVLAMAGEPDQPRIAAARRYLIEVGHRNPDLENVCWAKIALTTWAECDPGAKDALPELQGRVTKLYDERSQRGYLGASSMRDALTLLALSSKPFANHFAAVANGKSPTKTPAQKKPSWSERLGAGFRGLLVKAGGSLRPVTVPARVHIATAASYEAPLAEIIRGQYESFRAQVPLKDKRVVLKPNMVEYHPDKVINTNPAVVGAVIELCQSEGAKEVIVAEGPGHWRNVEYILTASGLGAVLQKYGVRFVDLNHDNPVEMPNLGRCTKMENLYLSETVARAEVLISMPKLKTHHWAGVTLSLKNLFGTLPGQCYGWPKNELHWQGIENSIVDIALTRTPDLAIVDGIIGMEGDGPLNGEAKPMGVLVMGNDLLAVDATCARLMGLDADKVPHFVLAEQRKVGVLKEKDINQLGEQIVKLRKAFKPHPKFGFLTSAK